MYNNIVFCSSTNFNIIILSPLPYHLQYILYLGVVASLLQHVHDLNQLFSGSLLGDNHLEYTYKVIKYTSYQQLLP